MDCPKCGKAVRQPREGQLALACDACGWGAGARDFNESEARAGETASGFRIPLGLGWALSLVILLGPYVAARIAIARLDSAGHGAVAGAADRLLDLLNLHYGWVMFLYVAIAALITPSYDPHNLGLFGWSRIDNPLTFEDDRNRAMRNLAVLLYPGKIVWATISHTWTLWSERSA